MDHLVVDTVEVSLVLLIPGALGLPCGKTALVVGIVLKGRQLRERVGTTLEGDLRRSNELAVLRHESVLLLQLSDDSLGERALLNLGIDEHEVAVFGGEASAEGAREQGLGPTVFRGLQLRHGLVPKVALCLVELVARIDGVTDVRELVERHDLTIQLVVLKECLARLRIIAGIAETLSQAGYALLRGFDVRSLIRHVLELDALHRDNSFVVVL